jgi:hypothetical protein
MNGNNNLQKKYELNENIILRLKKVNSLNHIVYIYKDIKNIDINHFNKKK